MFIFLLFLLGFFIFLEGTVTTLPLALILILCLTILKRDVSIFPVAFFAGLLLDLFTLRPFGVTSIFFLCVVLLVLLYQRKYEINSYPFVFTASFLGSVVFLLVFGYGNVWPAVISSFIAIVLFGGIKILAVKKFSI